jgi:hypothetical protein
LPFFKNTIPKAIFSTLFIFLMEDFFIFGRI